MVCYQTLTGDTGRSPPSMLMERRCCIGHSPAMTSAPAVQLSRLREIGWELWDPIGLRDVRHEGCDNEYDSYLLQVVSRLRRGQTVSEIASYLIHIETVHMGLGSTPSSSSLPRAAATISAIAEYLDTLPKGPIGIR